jgi:hypothetical protein
VNPIRHRSEADQSQGNEGRGAQWNADGGNGNYLQANVQHDHPHQMTRTFDKEFVATQSASLFNLTAQPYRDSRAGQI